MRARIVTREQFEEFFGVAPDLVPVEGISVVAVNAPGCLPYALEVTRLTGGVDEGGGRARATGHVLIKAEGE